MPERTPAEHHSPSIAERISSTTARVFSRVVVVTTAALGLALVGGIITWVLLLAAFASMRSLGVAFVALLVCLVPAGAAWLLRRRARAVGESIGDLRGDVQKLLDDPAASAVLDRFFKGRSHRQDDAIGITGLARGAASIRRLVKQQGATVGHLRAATTTAMTTPPVLAAVAIGLFGLGALAVIAILGLVF
mgnify:CR=1 FL=1